MNSNRSRRYYKKHPDFSSLPADILLHIAQYLQPEGIKPTKGTITSNYYNTVYGNDLPVKHGIRYSLVNSPTRPLTERTKKIFANAQKSQGKKVARIHKNEAARRFLSGLYKKPVAIKSQYVNGGSPIYPSPPSSIGSSYNSNNVNAVGGHMYLNANFAIGPSKSPRGTRNDFMRTSKSVRSAVRPGPKRRAHKR